MLRRFYPLVRLFPRTNLIFNQIVRELKEQKLIQNVFDHLSPNFENLPENVKQLPYWNSLSTHALINDFLGDLNDNSEQQNWSELHLQCALLREKGAEKEAKEERHKKRPSLPNGNALCLFDMFCGVEKVLFSGNASPESQTALRESIRRQVLSLIGIHHSADSPLTLSIALILDSLIERAENLVFDCPHSIVVERSALAQPSSVAVCGGSVKA